MPNTSGIRRADLLAWSFASIFLAHAALAGVQSTPSATGATYADECGSCHAAYPARLLPPADWGVVLAHLDRHFGTDAALDDPTRDAIARRLGVSPAQLQAPATTPVPRITAQRWFRQEHDEISAQVFRSPAVKSAANCGACHAGAEQGNFDEDAVNIPRQTR